MTKVKIDELLAAVSEHCMTADIHAALGGDARVAMCTVQRALVRAENATWVKRERVEFFDVWELTEFGKQRLQRRRRAS